MEENYSYTLAELLEALLEDETWEPDSDVRKRAVEMLKSRVIPNV